MCNFCLELCCNLQGSNQEGFHSVSGSEGNQNWVVLAMQLCDYVIIKTQSQYCVSQSKCLIKISLHFLFTSVLKRF